MQYNKTTGLIDFPNNYFAILSEGANRCQNGKCSVLGESEVVKGCESAETI